MTQIVTIIIVTWNRRECVIELLDSLRLICFTGFNIIVVDNASTDGSVEAIRNHLQPVILIENCENIGGTGGFNTGLRYALDNLEQDYIWLLDNDAIADKCALAALIEAMEQDHTIAIAGSKILNSHDPTYIVETGACIDWSTASILPVNRNVANSDNEQRLFDVDYVAICSALFRVSALKKVGVMDERYFLLWDDMDWGVAFKQAGFRVVAVNNSIIYHPPFTEKRSLPVDNYYGIRNPLLTVSKRTSGVLRFRAVLSLCRRACRMFYLTCLDQQYFAMQLCRKALVDFLCNKWGKLSLIQGPFASAETTYIENVPWAELKGKILVLNSGPVEVINQLVSMLHENCGDLVTIDVVLQSDRQELLESANVSKVVSVDFEMKGALLRNFWIFIYLQKEHYHLAINPSKDRTSPFAYVAPNLARFDQSTKSLSSQKSHHIGKVILAVILYELTAVVIFPILYVRSLIYSRSNKG